NATPEGFLRHSWAMTVDSAPWHEQEDRFRRSMETRHQVVTDPFHSQDRTRPLAAPASPPAPHDVFANVPDTDLTVPANRVWALAALGAAKPPVPAEATETEVDVAVAHAADATVGWSRLPGGQRRKLLEAAGHVMDAGRADAVTVMATEAGKTFAEADPEVSEGVDYARWYAAGINLLDTLDAEVASEPCGVVVVSPPWNFPYAIPAGGVLAALAAGNTAILKPSPEAPATAAVLVAQLHRAGLDHGLVQLVTAPDGPAGRRLITHPSTGAVILTGSWDTARLFARWAPHRRLLAETSGKNAVVVTAAADVDQAVSDLVRSAFGHAGQKCSAASLAIVDASLYDNSPFLRQLADAVGALRVGMGNDPASQVGPIVGPFTESLERALTRLDPGETWLVEPRCLDGQRRLWSPGVRIGVRPGSWAHETEWFGPVLGVMRAGSLDQALAWQNAVAYGLTAGLQSLDPTEHRRWVDTVEAGNLYVNRPTTGALVGRQPFGGWKRSSMGPTAKTGGPNYLLALRRWRDAHDVGVDETIAHYRHWWDCHFGRTTELAGLASESNELRYRPFDPGVIVRIDDEVSDDELAKALGAADLTGTTVRVSSARPRPGRRTGTRFTIESSDALALSLARSAGARLRLLGRAEPDVLAAAAAQAITVICDPVCSHGRIELVRWLREQVVTRSLHRYGNVVYAPLGDSPAAASGVVV
ncbi:MAG TPA: aldehyde dehydrogenase family protein, partial [Acidimicrobiales bacterium]|nr:aldehyde dehydrogenase family protein [Acidimicrobiales bacterium]